MKRVCDLLVNIALVCCVAMIVAFAGVRLVGLTPYAVLSGSMEPDYPVGSLVYVRAVDPASVGVGDAITFTKPNGEVATHQVYERDVSARQFRTQGIANINTDGSIMHDAEPVSFDAVIGAPVACIPLLGYVNVFVTSGPGAFLVVVSVGVLIVLSMLADRSRKSSQSVRPAHMKR